MIGAVFRILTFVMLGVMMCVIHLTREPRAKPQSTGIMYDQIDCGGWERDRVLLYIQPLLRFPPRNSLLPIKKTKETPSPSTLKAFLGTQGQD